MNTNRMTCLFVIAALTICNAFDNISSADAHGFLLYPKSRNYYHGVGPQFPSSSNMGGMGDTANLNAGIGGGPSGMALEQSQGHELCGDTALLNRFTSPNSPYSSTPVQAVVNAGSVLEVQVKITAYHYGWFEFRLCTSSTLTQACLNQNVLEIDQAYNTANYASAKMARGLLGTLDYIGAATSDYSHKHTLCDGIPAAPKGSCCNGGGTCSAPAQNKHRWMLPAPGEYGQVYKIGLKIPAGISCDKCVLQWFYQTGNSVDNYPEGFWNCADIQVLASGATAQPTTPDQTLSPTTGHPTLATVPPSNPTSAPVKTAGQCTGLPCSSLDMCRSEWGYCGIGASWCNERSQWTKDCLPPGTNPNRCTGAECTIAGQCRSASNFCGSGSAYCNDNSIWTSACVTPNLPTPKPTTKVPTTAGETPKPTQKPVVVVPPPSTGNGGVGAGCTGEPCSDVTLCRSKWGYCGIGSAWCNSESTWKAGGCGTTGNQPSVPPTAPTSSPTTKTCQTTTFDNTFTEANVGNAKIIKVTIPTELSPYIRFEFISGSAWRVQTNVQFTSSLSVKSSYDASSGTLSLTASNPVDDKSAALSSIKGSSKFSFAATSTALVAGALYNRGVSTRSLAAASLVAAALSSSTDFGFIMPTNAQTNNGGCGDMVVTVTVPSTSIWGSNPAGIVETRENTSSGTTIVTFYAPGQTPSKSPTAAAPTTARPTLKPSTASPTDPVLTNSPTAPTAPTAMPATASAFFTKLESKIPALNSQILLYQTPTMQWVQSSIYKAQDLVAALKVMALKGIDSKFFYLAEDYSSNADDNAKVALVGLAAFLAQSKKEAIMYDACDENNWDLIGGKYPLSNACGQLGQSYQSYSGAHACPVDPNMEIVATTNAKWYGAPGPFFCGPKSKTGSTGFWDYTYECNNPWKSPPEVCDAYAGQRAGRYDNSVVVANRAGRTDVEGCCWWGRGVIQSTGPGNYGDLNYFLGRGAAARGAVAAYPDVDFCKTPDAICTSSKYPELKWVAGLFYWLNSVQGYNSGGWEFKAKLKEYVAAGIQSPGSDANFIAAISGIVNRGCHNPPCAAGPVDGGSDRAKHFEQTLKALGVIN